MVLLNNNAIALKFVKSACLHNKFIKRDTSNEWNLISNFLY